MTRALTITILVDNPKSWIVPFAERIRDDLTMRGHHALLVHSVKEVGKGDTLFLLGCERLITKETLALNTHNIVVHPSDLPKGRGFSPLTWLILEGAHDVPITLFEATEGADEGPWYFKDVIHFEGHELNEALKRAQGEKTMDLVLTFVDQYDSLQVHEQAGESSWYPRRAAKDSELDPGKTIAEQFDLLRVVDNERYPAFFTHRDHTYIIKIFKKGDATDS